MTDRNISPTHDYSQLQGTEHYRAEDDIELPQIPSVDSDQPESPEWTQKNTGGSKTGGLSSILGPAALVGAIMVGGWFAMRDSSLEQHHPNWQHVVAATEASGGGAHQLIQVGGSGTTQTLQSIELTYADANKMATRQVRRALMRNDLVTATAVLQQAQNIPGAAQNSDVQLPQITQDAELALALKEGRKELFQIQLFDCCDEDGDIVEVLVNGTTFATVPITHGGTMLSIPLGRGHNTVVVRGVKDGGGGVTLSLRTSRGDYFARAMGVGEEHQMGVVVP